MQHLYDLADMLGVTIEYADLRRLGRDGDYDAETNTIRLMDGMAARLHNSVLAHELAHAVFGDVPSMFGPVHAKQERRADEWAALRLISPDAYRAAETAHEGCESAMAIDLSVTMSLVVAYRRLLLRIGPAVYLHPRMGEGQWDRKELVS